MNPPCLKILPGASDASARGMLAPMAKGRSPKSRHPLTARLIAQRATIIPIVITLIAGTGVAFLQLGNGDGQSADAPVVKPIPGKTYSGVIEVGIDGVSVEAVSGDASIPQATQDSVAKGVDDFLTRTALDPIRTAKQATGLEDLLTKTAFDVVTGRDEVVVTDAGLPKATGDVETILEPVTLTGLTDAAGNLVLIAASYSLTLISQVEAGPLRIDRGGYLMFSPSTDGWIISGYDVSVKRNVAGAVSSASASSTIPPSTVAASQTTVSP